MIRKIEVVPHNPLWRQMFEEEARQIQTAWGDVVMAIDHIGSTAIPGISAKPIIDILVTVQQIDQLDALNEQIEALGYEAKGEFGISGRRFFCKGGDENRSHHIHAFQSGASELKRHLAFRDYLIQHPDEAAEYSLLKEGLAKQFPANIEGYMAGKHAFIQGIDQKAASWRDKNSSANEYASS